MADVRLTATNPEDSSVVPVACDASGRLLLQEMPPAFDGTVDGDLTVSGKGSFGGGKSIIGNDGSAQFAQGAVDIYANGTVVFTQDVTFDGTGEFAGGVSINSDGDLGTYIGRGKGGSPSPGLFITKRDVNGDADVAYFEGNAGRSIIKGDGALDINDQNILLGADGSATFASPVIVGETGVGNTGTVVGNAGDITCRVNGGTSQAFTVKTKADNAENVVVKGDGSAVFAGNKAGFTAEGYLWCTTRRGDTVILDATSNGLASWVEYTPMTRMDRIRDGLNAIRGDAAEMPTDTP